jgi:hypothetical protein
MFPGDNAQRLPGMPEGAFSVSLPVKMARA